jgi:hypothetical protein
MELLPTVMDSGGPCGNLRQHYLDQSAKEDPAIETVAISIASNGEQHCEQRFLDTAGP